MLTTFNKFRKELRIDFANNEELYLYRKFFRSFISIPSYDIDLDRVERTIIAEGMKEVCKKLDE